MRWDTTEVPTYLGGRLESIVNPLVDEALDRFATTLERIARFDPNQMLNPAVVAASNRARAKAPRKRGLKAGAKATRAEERLARIWLFLQRNGYGKGRGKSVGFVLDAMGKFGVGRTTVMRAIAYGKQGLFDRKSSRLP